MLKYIILITLFLQLCACSTNADSQNKSADNEDSLNNKKDTMTYKINKTEEEWHNILTPEQYEVLRNKATERPFTGKYNLNFEKGMYYCAGCGIELFKSDTKFDSHCGWPSFYEGLKNNIIEKIDTSHGMIRTEILCANCGGHLGHVFDDGPNPTGLRYCVNSLSISFAKDSLSNK